MFAKNSNDGEYMLQFWAKYVRFCKTTFHVKDRVVFSFKFTKKIVVRLSMSLVRVFLICQYWQCISGIGLLQLKSDYFCHISLCEISG